MKKFLILLSVLFYTVAVADTITVIWDNGNQAFETTTCETGGNITLPQTTPTKRGYTFQGWKLLPYIPLEYIENTPSETYFNTGFYPTENSKVVVDFVKVQYRSGTCPVIKTTSNLFGFCASLSNEYPNHTAFWFNGRRNSVWNVSNTRHKYSLDKNAVYTDNVKGDDINQQNAHFTSTTPMFIFSESASTPTPCVIRIYSIQLYQNNVLVHDYVPAKKSDGTVCLYDKVTGDFLYNLGTFDPVAGPAL